MDRFNSLASQAKAKAEQGRLAALNQMNKLDGKSTSSGSTGAHSSLNDDDATTAPSTSSYAPPPPSRSRASSSATAAPPPPQRTTGGSTGVFVNINDADKAAFFSLLDEYFESRPQYRHLATAAPHISSSQSNPFGDSTPTSAVPSSSSPRGSAPPKPPARSIPAQSRGLGTATALYDFDAGAAEDLGFREGETITVLEHVSDEWLKGELRGQVGIFPKAYVQMN